MASGRLTDVKVLATGRAAGILIDATVIRALIVPALVTMFGRWNWCIHDGWPGRCAGPPSPPSPPWATAAA